MKIRLILAYILLLQVSFLFAQTKEVNLKYGWVFKEGDNPEYSQSDLSHAGWDTIKAGMPWGTQGHESYKGVAWYRMKLIIPSSMKDDMATMHGLKISLGKIFWEDVTYFNGRKIGQTEDPQFLRNYFISYDWINWDKENTIAVRVESPDSNAGLRYGPYTLTPLLPNEALVGTNKDTIPISPVSSDTTFYEKVFMKNKAGFQPVSGTMLIEVINKSNNRVLYKDLRRGVLNSAGFSHPDFSYTVTEEGIYKGYFTFIEDKNKDTITHETLLTIRPGNEKLNKLTPPALQPATANTMLPFAYENVKLNGYLQDKVDINLKRRLLKIDEIGITECFYNRPGKRTWDGEYAGKYLHAAARAWRYSHSRDLKTQMDRIASIVVGSQNTDGYLGSYLPDEYWSHWDVWAHKYQLLGLLSYYSVTGYKPALEACAKIGDLLCRTFGEQPGQFIIMRGEHLGMANASVLEPMIELYLYTGDQKHLDFCRYIIKAYENENAPKIVSGLLTAGEVNKVANAKAYEMMSNLLGIIDYYRITGEDTLLKAVKIAWDDIAANRLYITGSTSRGEKFREKGDLPAENKDHIGEACVSTTWLQFGRSMYHLTGEHKYMDEIEKTVYNHLIGAEDPHNGCVSYYTALQGKKPYRCDIKYHCCLASLPRGIVLIPELTFAKYADNGFAVNLYSGGVFADTIFTKAGIKLPVQMNVQTDFPAEGKVTLRINAPVSAAYKIALRVPEWCKDYKATVNGKTYVGKAGEYLVLDMEWQKASKIQINMQMNIQILDGGQSYPGHIAIKRGPQVLVMDETLNPEIKDWDLVRLSGKGLLKASPKALPAGWEGRDAYKVSGLYNNKPASFLMVPFADGGQTGGEIRTWIRQE